MWARGTIVLWHFCCFSITFYVHLLSLWLIAGQMLLFFYSHWVVHIIEEMSRNICQINCHVLWVQVLKSGTKHWWNETESSLSKDWSIFCDLSYPRFLALLSNITFVHMYWKCRMYVWKCAQGIFYSATFLLSDGIYVQLLNKTNYAFLQSIGQPQGNKFHLRIY